MLKNGVDNFTTVVKHEIILKKYALEEIKFLLYGYFFQDTNLLKKKKISLKFNLISDFIISNLITTLNLKENSISKKENTIFVNLEEYHHYDELINEQKNFLENLKNFTPSKENLKFFTVGWFLRYGSINNLDAKFYHLEIKLRLEDYQSILIKVYKSYHIKFNYLKRHNFAIMYIKKIDQISDFLKWIGTTESMMLLENTRITRDANNHIQRWENLDISNIVKTNFSNENQLNIIKELKKNKLYSNISRKEKIVCEFRIKYKELSLMELANKINEETNFVPKFTKSSIAYIFKKLNLTVNPKK